MHYILVHLLILSLFTYRNHGDPAGQLMVYGENGSGDHPQLLQVSGGMDVYIRKKPSCDPSTLIGDFE